MTLKDTAIKNAKPKIKPYKMADGAGLYLDISPKGTKSWRYDYKIGDKYATLTYGRYDSMSLAEAREAHKEAHKLVSRGRDPREHKKQQEHKISISRSNTFEAVAREWLDKKKSEVKTSTHTDITKRLETDVFTAIGQIPIKEVDTTLLLNMLGAISPYTAVTPV